MTGTPRYDPDTLLAELGWIRSLARRLVGQDAEDLVQETWAQALARPPGRDRPLRPWLATVARRLAANLNRTRRHRADREAVHARDGVSTAPSAAELVERSEKLSGV